MRVLGLDPSLSAYGWSIHDSMAKGRARRVASGHEQTLPSTVPVARFVHFRTLVDGLLKEYKPDLVGIESPAYSAGPFQTIHFGLMMFSMEAVFNHRKDIVLYDPATLKSLAKGNSPNKKGPMEKLDMQRFVQLDTMDPHLIDNNEADAYIVGYFAARFMGIMDGTLDPKELNPNELKTFLLKKKPVATMKGKKLKSIGHAFRENNRFYRFSQVPSGEVALPQRGSIRSELLDFLVELENADQTTT